MKRLPLDVILLVAVTVGYVAWRAPGDLVWDDSPAVVDNLTTGSKFSPEKFAQREFVQSVWVNPFRGVYGDGYRPLSTVLSRLGITYCGASSRAPIGLLLFNGLV